MSSTVTGLAALPASTHAALQELADALQAAAGDNFASLLVHGSAARGEFVEGASDVDAIVVLKDTSLPKLDAIANALVVARNRGRVDTMILKLDEIEPSTDVFPVYYEEIAQRHVVVRGSDPFAGLTAKPEYRRLRIEQELREAKIRMKRAAVDATGSPRLLAGALERKVRQIRSPLRALLVTQGVSVGDRLGEVLRAAAARYGGDAAPLLEVRKDPAAAHAAFRRLIDGAIEEVDKLEVRS